MDKGKMYLMFSQSLHKCILAVIFLFVLICLFNTIINMDRRLYYLENVNSDSSAMLFFDKEIEGFI